MNDFPLKFEKKTQFSEWIQVDRVPIAERNAWGFLSIYTILDRFKSIDEVKGS